MVLQFIWRRDFHLGRTMCRNLWGFLFVLLTGFTSFVALHLLPIYHHLCLYGLTFLLESLTVTLRILLLWIYLLPSILAFVPQWLSVNWKILINFNWLSIKLKRKCLFLSHGLRQFSCWLEQSSWSYKRYL